MLKHRPRRETAGSQPSERSFAIWWRKTVSCAIRRSASTRRPSRNEARLSDRRGIHQAPARRGGQRCRVLPSARLGDFGHPLEHGSTAGRTAFPGFVGGRLRGRGLPTVRRKGWEDPARLLQRRRDHRPRRWLWQRRIPERRHRPALFLSDRGRRLCARAVEDLVTKYARLASIDKHVTPHVLRHSTARRSSAREMVSRSWPTCSRTLHWIRRGTMFTLSASKCMRPSPSLAEPPRRRASR